MRRALILLAAALVAVVLLLVIALSFLNVDRSRPKIESELQQKLNRPVAFGQLHLRLFPLSIKVSVA